MEKKKSILIYILKNTNQFLFNFIQIKAGID
jgi:hypothetical protein